METGWLGGVGWTIVMTASMLYLAVDLYMTTIIASWANSDERLDSRMEALHRGLAKSPICCKPRKCCLCCCSMNRAMTVLGVWESIVLVVWVLWTMAFFIKEGKYYYNDMMRKNYAD